MKIIIIVGLILLTKQIYSQKTKIQVLNLKDNKPIENVLIYSDSLLIAKTNDEGLFNLNLRKYNKISLIKEDFYDTIINVDNSNKIFLKKINAIQLKEIVVTNINVNNLLDSISDYKKRLKNVIETNYTHFYNLLTINNDTLLYLNNRLFYRNRVGYFCLENNYIIRNFTANEKLTPIFEYKSKSIVFKNNFLHFSSFPITTELQIITKVKKLFNYKVSKDDSYYKIEISPQKNNNEYPYYGYIIVDNKDFGIYEFKINTNKQKDDIRTVVLNNKLLKYKILNEEIFIKYNKNKNGKYELVTCNFDSSLESLNGFFKGHLVTNKCRKEPTLPFDNSNAKRIDLTTYKIIK